MVKSVVLLCGESNGQSSAVEHYVRSISRDVEDIEGKLAKIAELISNENSHDSSGGVRLAKKYRNARCSVFHIMVKVLDAQQLSKQEKTSRIIALLGKKFFENAYFEGPIVGLDLSEVLFEDTEFQDVSFRNCVLGRSTRFVRCKFLGSFYAEENCIGISEVSCESCEYSVSAKEYFISVTKDSRVDVSKDHIIDVLFVILSKMYANGRFKTITEQDMLKGVAGKSDLSRDIYRELFPDVLYHHTISGVGKNAGVAIGKSAMSEVRAFMENRVTGKFLTPLVKRISKTWCE